MKILVKEVVVCIALAIFCVGAWADSQCPREIQTDQSLKGEVGAWKVLRDQSAHSLSEVKFFSGPPDQMLALKYDDDVELKNGSYYLKWRFPAGNERYWVACYYGRTYIGLSMALPDGVSECRVDYSRTKRPQILGMVCK